MIPRAKEPFRFFTRLSLTILTGLKAKDLKELLEHIKAVPESVIYEHTHKFLQQHHRLMPEPSNDFAYWATHILQDEVLGERLAAVDTIRFNSLNDLRQAIVSVIENHLSKSNSTRQVPAGKEFYFMRAIRFSVPTPHQAYDLAGFLEELKKVSISSLYLHIFEARLRPPLGVNDFSQWFDTELGEKALAKKIAGLDPYNQTLEGLRSRISGFIEKRLQESSHAAT
jgi:hypothetical protein